METALKGDSQSTWQLTCWKWIRVTEDHLSILHHVSWCAIQHFTFYYFFFFLSSSDPIQWVISWIPSLPMKAFCQNPGARGSNFLTPLKCRLSYKINRTPNLVMVLYDTEMQIQNSASGILCSKLQSLFKGDCTLNTYIRWEEWTKSLERETGGPLTCAEA